MTTNRKNDKWQMLNFQCRQPNRTTMARTLNLALLFGHPIYCWDVLYIVGTSYILLGRPIYCLDVLYIVGTSYIFWDLRLLSRLRISYLWRRAVSLCRYWRFRGSSSPLSGKKSNTFINPEDGNNTSIRNVFACSVVSYSRRQSCIIFCSCSVTTIHCCALQQCDLISSFLMLFKDRNYFTLCSNSLCTSQITARAVIRKISQFMQDKVIADAYCENLVKRTHSFVHNMQYSYC